MKVIAKIDSDDYGSSRVIVEITKEELENIRGKGFYLVGQYGNSTEIKVGSVIKVDKLFDEARQILAHYDNFKKTISDFKDGATFLEKLLNTKNFKE